ncbi:MAG: xanthine dehydrogenase family protein molybdopterin-binding subunit [Pedococcus sp.]
MTLAPERTARPSAPPAAGEGPSQDGPAIGRAVDRVDGLAKASGTARFSAEYPIPGLTHAVLVHAPIARGRIVSIDVAQAEAHPSVVLVLTHLNAPRLTPPPTRLNPMDLSTLAGGSLIAFLNTDEVHVDGQPVAAVVAETLESAQYAASLVRVSYETATATADFDAELPHAKAVRSMPVMPPTGGKRGDARAAYAKSPVRVDLSFTTPQHNHNALEPHATTAVWDGKRLTVYEGCQNMDWTQKFLAKRFDLPASDVHVVSKYVGGAFGGKSKVWAATLITCMAAKVSQRPVRLALTREGVYRTVGGRTPTRQRVAIGASRAGHMEALIHQATSRKGRVGGDADQITACSLDLYDAATILAEQKIVELDLMTNTAMRAPGEAQGSFAVESAVDELAIELGLDPVALRLMNQPADKSPVHGTRYSHRRLAQTLEEGRDLFGWADRPAPGTRDGKDLVGWGVAAAIHPAWEFVANVQLTVDATGGATLACAFHEMGMGTATVVGQMVAYCLGVPLERVSTIYGDSDLPIGPGAGGSGQTASLAGSIEKACQAMRRRLDALASKAGMPDGSDPAEVLTRAGDQSLTVEVGADTGPKATWGQVRFLSKMVMDSRRWMKAATGAHYCEVRVDADTGELRIRRWTSVFDVGRVVNPKTTHSQLRGGIVMGLGMAMGEETLIDTRTARIMNPSLAEYHVPVHADVPHLDVRTLDDPDPQMPLGILGAGEVGIVGVGAAVANAVRHATGRRVTDLPLTLDRIVG